MMTLLKIGRRYINFDQVRYIDEDDAKGVCIYFSGENSGGAILQLRGEEAAVLKQWLGLNSTEVKSHPVSWHPVRTRLD